MHQQDQNNINLKGISFCKNVVKKNKKKIITHYWKPKNFFTNNLLSTCLAFTDENTLLSVMSSSHIISYHIISYYLNRSVPQYHLIYKYTLWDKTSIIIILSLLLFPSLASHSTNLYIFTTFKYTEK